MATAESLPDFDRSWNYQDPALTERQFRALLPRAREAGCPDYLGQLLTQIARTQSLQRHFDQAHETLDEVEALLDEHSDDLEVVRIRYLLERGRTYNSAGKPDEARPRFEEAWELARGTESEDHAIDAAHMIAITLSDGADALEWNEKGLELAEASDDPEARKWIGSLTNNIGWTLHDQEEYERALDVFERALEWRIEQRQPRETRIARYAVARTLRSLGRVDEALAMQRDILKEIEEEGAPPDGYVYEEIAECLLEKEKPEEAQPYFKKAHRHLSRDAWLKEDEPERIQRLKRLAEED